MNAKPRLKLHLTGHVSVLAQGSLDWSAKDARASIKKHYGSIGRFARQLGVSYDAACSALRDPGAARMAGKVATVRQTLGLPSTPSKRALITAGNKLHGRRV